MTTNVEDLTREQLEDIVLAQAAQIKALQGALESSKSRIETLEEETEELGFTLMAARSVLSC